jgi:hypothetical protein
VIEDAAADDPAADHHDLSMIPHDLNGAPAKRRDSGDGFID